MEYLNLILDVSFNLFICVINKLIFVSLFINKVYTIDALHLSIPSQGLQNGDAALQHAAAYPGMQPYPGVGEFNIQFCLPINMVEINVFPFI